MDFQKPEPNCQNCQSYGCWGIDNTGKLILVNPCANCSTNNNPRYGRREDPIYNGSNECYCNWDCRHPLIRKLQNAGIFE